MSTPSSDATVRYATISDVPTILSLIHDLAAYENSSASVLATERTLRDTLSFPPFPSAGYARTLLIVAPGGAVAGFALFFPTYSTWRAAPGLHLEDLFVGPAFRGRGYGRRLLGELAREARAIGAQRLEWSVLKYNEPGLAFYGRLGAERMEGWVGMRVEGEEELEGLGRWGRGVGGGMGEVEVEVEERVGIEKRGLDEEERRLGG